MCHKGILSPDFPEDTVVDLRFDCLIDTDSWRILLQNTFLIMSGWDESVLNRIRGIRVDNSRILVIILIYEKTFIVG